MSNIIYPKLVLTPKQSLAWDVLSDHDTKYLLWGAGAGSGKSYLGCSWETMMCYQYPGSKWFVGRKELKRLMGSTYITFMKLFKDLKIPESDWKLNGQYNYIEFKNGSRIDLLDLASKPQDPLFERFGSLEYTGGWIEEAGEVEFLAFDTLKSRIGRHLNDVFSLSPAKMLLTCNPTQNWLYRVFYKPFRAGTLPPSHSFIQALHGDNPHLDSDYASNLESMTDYVLKARLLRGVWEYTESDLSLIKYDAILDMFSNVPEFSQDLYLTADIARHGGDRIVYGIWRGLDLTEVIWKQRQGLDQTITDIRTLLFEKRIPYSHAVIDEDGVGGGVIDALKGVKGFTGNSAPLRKKHPITGDYEEQRDNYQNLRSQCLFMIADYLNNHKISVSAQIGEDVREWIIEELQQIKRKNPDADTKLAVIPKDDIKEAIGRSPDFADMIMMRMFFELEVPQKTFQTPQAVGGVKPYF